MVRTIRKLVLLGSCAKKYLPFILSALYIMSLATVILHAYCTIRKQERTRYNVKLVHDLSSPAKLSTDI